LDEKKTAVKAPDYLNGSGTRSSGLMVEIRGMDMFKELVDLIQVMVRDERVPKEYREAFRLWKTNHMPEKAPEITA
jgi:hypothetical protein